MCGMRKTTVYLPDEIKSGVEREARLRSCSEAEFIRQAIGQALARAAPRAGIIAGDSAWAREVDDLLTGFGE